MQANKNFFQILLSTDQEQDDKLPDLLEEASLISQSQLPDFFYKRWNNRSLRDFIAESFAVEVLNAYEALKPLSYKADLGRFCLLYAFGGWYADISLKIVSPLLSEVDCKGLGFFRDYGPGIPSPMANTFDVMTALIYAEAGHPALKRCIDQIVRHVSNRYYGFTSVSPTGPRLFGRILAGFDLGAARQIGHFMPLTPGFNRRNLAYVSNAGIIYGWHKSAWHPEHPGGGDLASVGLKGTNNYNQMWRSRQVYGEESRVN